MFKSIFIISVLATFSVNAFGADSLQHFITCKTQQSFSSTPLQVEIFRNLSESTHPMMMLKTVEAPGYIFLNTVVWENESEFTGVGFDVIFESAIQGLAGLFNGTLNLGGWNQEVNLHTWLGENTKVMDQFPALREDGLSVALECHKLDHTPRSDI